MPRVNLYVRPEDRELWERAKTYAHHHRMPVSGLVMIALAQYLDRAEIEERRLQEWRRAGGLLGEYRPQGEPWFPSEPGGEESGEEQ